MTRPRLLDLFCGAGGAGEGYRRAGFDVLGVDIKPQPNYCAGGFIQADALEYLAWLTDPASNAGTMFHAIHASPPCPRYSVATPNRVRDSHPDLLPPVRELLKRTGLPWIIENVPGAPMRADLKLCGCIFGLDELERERWFELGFPFFDLRQPCHRTKPVVVVTGHGRCRGMKGTGLVADWRRAMGIDWMTRDELTQAIPPAYTEYIGRALLEHLAEAAA